MPDSPLTDSRVPDGSYAADIASIVTNAITDIESYACPRYDSSNERDLAYTAWQAATGRSIEDGMSCWVADHYEDRIDGAWTERASSTGLVAFKSNEDAAAGSISEARIPGGHNIPGTRLVPGRSYEAIAKGWVQATGADGAVILKLRARRGDIPTTSSAVVGDDLVYMHATGTGGRAGFRAGAGSLFQVGTASTAWHIHLFGTRNAGVSMSSWQVVPDSRGVHSIAVYDRGPAHPNIPTI